MVFRDLLGKLRMGKDIEIKETVEGKVMKSPKEIETFDSLRGDEAADRKGTFDDIAKQGEGRSIETFDDVMDEKDLAKYPGGEEGMRPLEDDSFEKIERERIKEAGERIKGMDWMKPDKWKDLTKDQKETALRHCGRVLRDIFHTPDPPLLTYKGKPEELGVYGDGWSYSKTAIFDQDYGIRMNEDGQRETREKLFGDHPRTALETYAHEFRHSYQCEQAQAFDRGFKTDSPRMAEEWSGNLGKNYIEAPSSELAKTNPEEYKTRFEAYENQPLEKDARRFASELVSEVYDVEK